MANQWKLPYADLKFQKKIGKGNFGEVYDGEYLGTRVAIKKLYFVDDDFMQKYIEREMDTLTGLAHPNIVQLIGLCIETDDMYIVTEFVSGGDLRSKLKETTLTIDWPTRLAIARDIALAMNYLHSKNIMHRDLKSHNLLVAEGWKIKVCDFGLARSAPNDSDRNLMTIVGTNEWMAPEVAMGENYALSADVFSYGMVLFEIITREKPPQRKLKDMYAFNHEEYLSHCSSEMPPEMWQLLKDCTHHTPQDRPTFKDVVKRLLQMIKEFTPAAGSAEPKKEPTKEEAKPVEKKDENGKPTEKKKKKKTTDGEKKKKKKKTDGDGTEKKKKKKSSKDKEGGEEKKKKKKTKDGTEKKKKKTKDAAAPST
eukprot:TRINITY_DN175_c0_g1_i1.p1 TRINITY_DN175_c0_g1~~TRINITY_DN175_c0_g1_i1.p1  ORF type:complete len:367 (+),score=135.80 TRINITY_DN175_c0_g1_i1:124-1224(+)